MENPAPEDAPWRALKVPPGSSQDRGMRGEKRTNDCLEEGSALNSGGPVPFPPDNRRDTGNQLTEDAGVGMRESDSPIVLGDGNAVHMGKGRAGKQRKHSTHHGTRILPTTVSSSLLALGTSSGTLCRTLVPCARFSEEPGAVIPHAGICEGGVGQPASLPQSAT